MNTKTTASTKKTWVVCFPAEVCDDSHIANMKVSGFAVWCVLLRFAGGTGEAFPSIPTLSKITGMTKPTIIKAIRHLEDTGYIKKTQRSTSKTPNHYVVAHSPADLAHIKTEGSKNLTPTLGVKEFDVRGKEFLRPGVKEFDVRGKEFLPEEESIKKNPGSNTHEECARAESAAVDVEVVAPADQGERSRVEHPGLSPIPDQAFRQSEAGSRGSGSAAAFEANFSKKRRCNPDGTPFEPYQDPETGDPDEAFLATIQGHLNRTPSYRSQRAQATRFDALSWLTRGDDTRRPDGLTRRKQALALWQEHQGAIAGSPPTQLRPNLGIVIPPHLQRLYDRENARKQEQQVRNA